MANGRTAPPGDVLREARERQGLSQQEMADRLDVSQNTISGYESGEKLPRTHRLAQVAAGYGVDVRRIIPAAPRSRKRAA
jgi:transcriptional regulator with XRE-family HTH domain